MINTEYILYKKAKKKFFSFQFQHTYLKNPTTYCFENKE
jgi:hypothetical protein